MTGAIAFAAQWLIIVPALLVAAVILVRRSWKRDLVEAFLAGAGTIALVKIAGTLFVEPRPFVVEHLHPLVAHAPDNAFPSDHLAACGLACAYLFVRSRVLAAAALLTAGAIAYARVAAHLHWPPDVAVGFLLGTLAAAFARSATQKITRQAA
jgi:undecaprenyl-diphosphatase